MVDPNKSFLFTHIIVKYSPHDHILQPKGISRYLIIILEPKIFSKSHFIVVVGGMFFRTRSYKDLQQRVVNVFYDNIILLGRNGNLGPHFNCYL
jgi:hypothetical protein